MKTVLITGYDESFAPLGDLTIPYMDAYAKRHGYDFRCYREPLLNVPNGIYWTGVAGAVIALEYPYDRVIYLDADQFITNTDWAVPEDWTHFHASLDWGHDATEWHHFSACGFSATKECLGMMKHVLESEPQWRDRPFPEQGPLRHAATMGLSASSIHKRRVFNAVPDEVCPGKVPEPWQLGDWCCHLTMLPLNDRVELFKKIEEKVIVSQIGKYSTP